jgi:hypothetical protein
VITGFNTDVEYQGVTYHVQTEDKGVSTPLILSLVYDGGTILASKRSPYDDLLKDEFDEKALTERLEKQHKLICAAVKAGRIEDLKRMTLKNAEALKQKKLVVQKESRPPAPEAAAPLPEPVAPPPVPVTNLSPGLADTIDQAKAAAPPPRIPQPTGPPAVPKPRQELEYGFSIDITEEDLIIDGAEIVEEDMILPAEAVEIVSEFVTSGQKGSGKLGIDFTSETTFKGGERKTLGILIYRGEPVNAVNNAQIMVKVIGSNFRPLIFHAKTDEKGVATVHLQLPHFKSGRAALLVRAMSEGEESEIRRRISHG